MSNPSAGPDAPAVSVVMAVYNGEPYVADAIRSVLAQTFTDFEFIIVDDCSTDGTARLVEELGDQRIVYVRNESNIGQTASLNRGLTLARGALVARIDADDLFYPDKLRRQVRFLDSRPDVAVLGCACHIIDENGARHGLISPPRRRNDVLFRLCYGVPVVHVSVLVRAAALRDVGGYDADFRYSQDYALWSSLARAGYRITNLPDVLGAFRERSDSVNARNKLGGASAETAAITRRNAREIAGVELSVEECRAVDLLMFPEAELGLEEVIGAYNSLHRMARGIWGRVPIRIRVSLLGRLAWATTKILEHGRSQGGSRKLRSELLRLLRTGAPVGFSARLGMGGGLVLSQVGFRNAGRLKSVATRYLHR